MSRATPGPWTTAAQRNNTLIVSASENRAVAECFGVIDDEPRANARLIAAAPELLEALKTLATLKEEQIKGARGGVLFLQVPMAELQLAWAAIAKAEGR